VFDVDPAFSCFELDRQYTELFIQALDQDCTTFSLLPAALRLLLWITAASEFKIFYILHCFCSAFLHWPDPASTRLFGLLSTKYCMIIQQTKSF